MPLATRTASPCSLRFPTALLSTNRKLGLPENDDKRGLVMAKKTTNETATTSNERMGGTEFYAAFIPAYKASKTTDECAAALSLTPAEVSRTASYLKKHGVALPDLGRKSKVDWETLKTIA